MVTTWLQLAAHYLCMLVYLLCMYTLSACRNGHTCIPTIPRQHIVLLATSSIHTWPSRAMWEEHADITFSLLPGSWLEGGAWRDNFCMVVAAGFNLSPFGTRELRAQVVPIGSAASSHIHTTSELWYLLRWDSCGCTSHDSPTWLDVSR